jgi:hypothetical protein
MNVKLETLKVNYNAPNGGRDNGERKRVLDSSYPTVSRITATTSSLLVQCNSG